MSEHASQTVATLERPATDDRERWRDYWSAAGQPWRSEPEIAAERRAFLAERRALTPNVKLRAYPFAGVALTRADIEWLLATHEDGRGPVDWADEHQRRREGLDLRGADLRGLSLRGLPLARVRGGLAGGTPEQRAAAAAHFEGADLRNAQLDGADLREAVLDGADLRRASLAEAALGGASLAKADLREARVEGADLHTADLRAANLREARLSGADLREADLTGAELRDASLEAARLSKANLRGADLSEAHLEGGFLREAVLDGARLTAAHLEGADLYRVSLRAANLEAAHLAGCNLEAAHLEGANLYGAQLQGVRLPADDARRIRVWRRERAFPDLLPPADLRGAFLDATTNLRKLSPGDQEHGAIRVADVVWGGANLAVVPWARNGRGATLVLGDEREARRRTDIGGAKKPAETRLLELEAAVRANRQLAVALQAQGLDEAAAEFAYRGKVLQRAVLRRQGRPGKWLFSLLLDALAGYGYRPLRTLALYVALVLGFAAAYFAFGLATGPHLHWYEALVVSLTAFHGRVFSEGFHPGDPQGVLAAIEAVCGLLIEASFIATFTQRFFAAK